MREHDQEPQSVMTLPLLEGLDGGEKMSKSLGNYVAVEDEPFDMFGKLMSISDELMWKYWLLLTDRTQAEIDEERSRVDTGKRHPMDVKKELARTVVAEFHSPDAATAAQQEFERVFSARNLPQDIPAVEIEVDAESLLLAKAMVLAGLAPSNSQARRLITQGAVKVEGEVVRDIKAALDTRGLEPTLVQVGKRKHARVNFLR
jgi:tyrosyl-tRNA synthetase